MAAGSWQLVQRVPLIKPSDKIDPLVQETDELIRIFVKSIETAQQRGLARSMFKVGR